MSITSYGRIIRYAKQTTPDETPVALAFLDFQGDNLPRATKTTSKQQVNEQTDLAMNAVAQDNSKGNASIAFPTMLRGLGVAKGDGAAATGSHLNGIFDVLFGMAGQAGTGDTADGSGHSTTSVKLASTTAFKDGTDGDGTVASGMMINTSATAFYMECREVDEIKAGELVPDRAFETAPSGAEVIHPAMSWGMCYSNPDRASIYLDSEGGDPDDADDWRDILLGCGVKASVSCDASRDDSLALLALDFVASDYDDDEAKAEPTYSAPTAAKGIPVPGSILWLDSTKTHAQIVNIDFGQVPSPVYSQHANRGIYGYTYSARNKPLITITCRRTAALEASLRAAGTVIDLAYQLGNPAAEASEASLRHGNTFYFRIPCFECDGAPEISEVDGIEMLTFKGSPTRVSGKQHDFTMHCF